MRIGYSVIECRVEVEGRGHYEDRVQCRVEGGDTMRRRHETRKTCSVSS